jgi:nucleoside-diphosphate-sugar epimerase
MTSPSSVLILGARGRFGSAAVRAFAMAGWQVHAQARPGAEGEAMAGVQWVYAAPDDTQALAHAARDAQVVVQALSPEYTHKAWRTQVPRFTQAAIDISRELGATLMLPGNIYNFGAGMPAQLREDTPQQPTTFKGQLRVASEQMIKAATRDGRMKAVVIRGGDFFGSGKGSWLDLSIAKDLSRGRVSYPNALHTPTAWAYLPDMACSFVGVAEQRERLAAFETMHFAGYSVTGQQWVDVLTDVAREQGVLPVGGKLKVSLVPWPLLRLMGLLVPTLAALCEMRYLWTTPHALVNTRMTGLIGAEPHTPFAQAVRAALADLDLPVSAAGSEHRQPLASKKRQQPDSKKRQQPA